MYHAETDTPAVARTSNLNEELGQVSAHESLGIACYATFGLSRYFLFVCLSDVAVVY